MRRAWKRAIAPGVGGRAGGQLLQARHTPVWLHVYKELDARNRAEGYTTALRISHSF